MKKLKTKIDFYTKVPLLLNKGLSISDIAETIDEYTGVTHDDLEKIVSKNSLSKGIASGLVSATNQKAIIYNELDKKFVEKHPNLVLFRRGENSVFFEYRHGVYYELSEQDMYDLVDNIMEELSLFEYRNSSHKVKDTIKRISSLLARTIDKYFQDEKVYKQEWKLNLKNGLLDMNTWELKEHTPDYFSTVQVPYNYNPESQVNLFQKFIETVSDNDQSTAKMIQEMFGYCILEGNPKHRVFYLYGDTARNGKSTTAKLLAGLIGWGNVSTLSLGQIAGENSSILTSIIGKQINFSDEISSKYIESSRLTQMSAEGVVEVNPKFKSSFLYQIKAKFIIACNDLPQFKDSQGMKHRMISIPFNHHFEPKDRIDRYEEILLEKEGSAILNWAIEGAKMIREQKDFTINEQSKEDMYENASQSNSVYAFLDSNYIFNEEYTEEFSVMDLYGRVESRDMPATKYRQFCKERGISPLGAGNFAKELKRYAREMGKVKQNRNKKERYYTGLAEKEMQEFNKTVNDFKDYERTN